MKNAIRGMLVSLTSIAALTFGSAALAQDAARVTFPGPNGVTLSGVRYTPAGFAQASNLSAVVMMHGCSGMWSNRDPSADNTDGTPNLQNNVEKWGLELAAQGVVALAVDSFTTRTPAGVSDNDWQNQCSGATYASAVDSYTTRADDARAGYDWLAGDTAHIDGASIALLGWSHGAQASLVQAAATPRTSNTARASADMVFAATVVFYPGCGSALGFNSPSSSYFRPYADLRLNIGDADSFYANCQTRADRAVNNYGSTAGSGHEVVFAGYSGAAHSFDNFSQTWPTTVCTGSSTTGDECAMRDADIESLEFLLGRI